MRFDRVTPGHDIASAFFTESEPELLAKLRMFGLIEPDGKDGWRLTDCCRTGLTTLERDGADASPALQPAAVVRPWKPRTL